MRVSYATRVEKNMTGEKLRSKHRRVTGIRQRIINTDDANLHRVEVDRRHHIALRGLRIERQVIDRLYPKMAKHRVKWVRMDLELLSLGGYHFSPIKRAGFQRIFPNVLQISERVRQILIRPFLKSACVIILSSNDLDEKLLANLAKCDECLRNLLSLVKSHDVARRIIVQKPCRSPEHL